MICFGLMHSSSQRVAAFRSGTSSGTFSEGTTRRKRCRSISRSFRRVPLFVPFFIAFIVVFSKRAISMTAFITLLCNADKPIMEQLKLDPPDSAFSAALCSDHTKQRICNDDAYCYLYSEWRSGKRSGRALVKDLNGTVLVNMRFTDGYMDGVTVLYVDDYQIRVPYTEGSPTGAVSVTRDMETVFKGSYVNGLPNGYGTQVLEDGKQFTGYYRNGYASGNGTLKTDSGETIISGEWKEGELGNYSVSFQQRLGFMQPGKAVEKRIAKKYPSFCTNESGIRVYSTVFENDAAIAIWNEEKRVFVDQSNMTQKCEEMKRRNDSFKEWVRSLKVYMEMKRLVQQQYDVVWGKRDEELKRKKREEELKRKRQEEERKRQEEERKRQENELRQRAAQITLPPTRDVNDSDSSSEASDTERRGRGALREELRNREVDYDLQDADIRCLPSVSEARNPKPTPSKRKKRQRK